MRKHRTTLFSLSCKELGAGVKSQVCKSVQVLVCTLSAVKKATQQIRKAFKKGIPIVEAGWLEKRRLEQKHADFETFRLDKEAEDAINNREESTARCWLVRSHNTRLLLCLSPKRYGKRLQVV